MMKYFSFELHCYDEVFVFQWRSQGAARGANTTLLKIRSQNFLFIV
jgi:hypothetical protein